MTRETTTGDTSDRRERLSARIREVFEEVAGFDIDAGDGGANFIELGMDSLMLTQVALQLQKAFPVKVTFRQLMGEYASLDRLVSALDAQLPPDEAPSPGAVPASVSAAAAEAPAAVDAAARVDAGIPSLTVPSMPGGPAHAAALRALVDWQMQLMARQLALLSSTPGAALAAVASLPSLPSLPAPVATPSPVTDESPVPDESCDAKKVHGAMAPIDAGSRVELTPHQRGRLDAFVQRYIARTPGSRAYAQRNRAHMADPRVVTGFRPLTKEIVYQIVVDRSKGARVWDIDGHEYVDALNGFGTSLFGWQPDFLVDAVKRQIDSGCEIGPMHPLAGEVTALVCELTGHDRAALCNTGSEAVLGAMRVARTVTGRETIVMFSGSYHGINDEVIVRGTKKLRAVPAAPGILRNTAEKVLVLEYGTPETLEIIRGRAHELAAVLVEPVQSRRPDLQPVEFLRELRKITAESGAALVFDEVITGFRAHPGGAQALFGIRADLATYGKVVGGGYPVGVIAGRREFMDALDGGHWQYGDDSVPTADVTYFAGTFVRHPLALAAARASLLHVKAQGPGLQEGLNQRTAAMASEINAFCGEVGAPVQVRHFASLWRTHFDEDHPLQDLLFAMMRSRGIHILDNFPCFLTTAHGEADIKAIVHAFKESILELQDAGLLPRRAATPVIDVPSTEPQREIWLASQLGDEASLAHSLSLSLRLRGALDVDRLRRSLQQVVARHDALRAVYAPDGQTFRVPEPSPLPVPLHDFSPLPPEERRQQLADHARRSGGTLFDLAHGPLFRAELVRLDAGEHVLLMHAHHIACDGWSWWVLIRELGTAYGLDDAAGTALPGAESYVDHARREAARLDAAGADGDEAYWLSRFATLPPALDLPTDRPRPDRRGFASCREDHELDADLVSAIRRLGARRGASLFATLLGSFASLLSRLSGQDDVVVGIPAAGQAVDGHANLVGHCVNLLPLRFGLQAGASVESVVDDAQALLLDALEHQRFTFGTLLKTLRVPRDPARLPLVSVMFNIDQAMELDGGRFPGLDVEVATQPRRHDNFELSVNAVQVGGRLRLETQYDTSLFDAATVRRWLAAFESLLRAACESPGAELAQLPLLDARAFGELAALQPPAVAFDRDCRMHELFERQCDLGPDRVALRIGQESLSYGQLEARANRIARLLRQHGVQAGALVGLALERNADVVAALLGILKAGAGYVPMDPHFPPERLAGMVEDAALAALVTQRDCVGAFTLPGRPVLVLDDPGIGLDALPDDRIGRDAGAAGPESPAYVIYTSGSTGRPKGVQVPHRAVSNFISSMQEQPGLDRGDRLLAVTTVSFDIAVLELMLPLSVGAEVVLADRTTVADGFALDALLRESGANVMQATPATWRVLIEAGWQGDPLFKALCGGEPLPPDLAQAMLSRCGELWNLYGPTETTVWSTATRVRAGEGGGLPDIHIGRPIANTQVWMLDANGQPCPHGVPGEICIGGEGVTLGYLGRPELTADRFIPDRFADPARGFGTGIDAPLLYRTGDRGRWRADGNLEHLGRLDFQIKVRGYRIEPGDIESSLLAHPAVSRAVVTTREHRPGDVRLVAHVVPAAPSAGIEAELASHLRAHLPDYMVPRHIVVLDAIPLLPNGKVDRKALAAVTPLPATAVAAPPRDPGPLDPRVAYLMATWGEILGTEVSPDDNFFDLGGHSMLAVGMANRVLSETGHRIKLLALATQTLGDLADELPVDAGTQAPVAAAEDLAQPVAAGRGRSLSGVLHRGRTLTRSLFDRLGH